MSNRLIAVLALASLFALPAWAAGNESASLFVTQPSRIGTVMLKPGSYRIRVRSRQSQATVYRHGRRIATVPAAWKRLPRRPQRTEILLSHNRVQQVRFGGRLMALTFPGGQQG